jgi:hypothetical protein
MLNTAAMLSEQFCGKLLVALGDESCRSSRQAGSGSFVVIYNWTSCSIHYRRAMGHASFIINVIGHIVDGWSFIPDNSIGVFSLSRCPVILGPSVLCYKGPRVSADPFICMPRLETFGLLQTPVFLLTELYSLKVALFIQLHSWCWVG